MPEASVVLYTSSDSVPVTTVVMSVVDIKATLGISKPLLEEVISRAPLGVVVPIPTCACNENDIAKIMREYKTDFIWTGFLSMK